MRAFAYLVAMATASALLPAPAKAESARELFEKGVDAWELENWGRAADLLDRAHAADPGRASVRVYLASALAKLGRCERVADLLDGADFSQQKDPDKRERIREIAKEAIRLCPRQAAPPPPAPPEPPGMVRVPAGPFWRGCNASVDSECDGDEKPYRQVTLSAFWIDRTEVTVAEYGRCVDAGRCSPPSTGNACNWGRAGHEAHPVNCVDWSQARDYCAWAGKRLPTEAEWEKAARGTDGRKYPWGNLPPASAGAAVANLADGTAKRRFAHWSVIEGYDDGHAETAPVGSFPRGASPYGALDMIGNVWEWVGDWYASDAYASGVTVDPSGPPSGESRVVRGASFYYDGPRLIRASYRYRLTPTDRLGEFGFRCARTD